MSFIAGSRRGACAEAGIERTANESAIKKGNRYISEPPEKLLEQIQRSVPPHFPLVHTRRRIPHIVDIMLFQRVGEVELSTTKVVLISSGSLGYVRVNMNRCYAKIRRPPRSLDSACIGTTS